MKLISYPLPPEYQQITQHFGENPDNYAAYQLAGHEGIDISCPIGTDVMAAHDGLVEVRYAESSYGLYIRLWGEELMTLYAHLSHTIPEGTHVKAGEVIAQSGNSGRSTGPHLHFGLYPLPLDLSNGYKGAIDPEPHLEKRGVKMDEALAEATAVRFEIEEIVRLYEEAVRHLDQAAVERAMADRCENQAKMRLKALINTKNGRAYRVEGLLGGALPPNWEG